MRDKIRPYLYIAPALCVTFAFTVFPIIYLVYLSLQKYNLMNPSASEFIGLKNYTDLLQRDAFVKAFNVTTIYTIATLILVVGIALLIAIYLKRGKKIDQISLGGAFIPHVISVVSISMIWMNIFDPNLGIANKMLSAVGLPTSQFLQSSSSALATVIFVGAWMGIGYNAVIIAGALQTIPVSVYEAAELDNASRFTTLRKITVPMISPQLFVTVITVMMSSFKVFDSVNVMTAGGPNKATTTLVYFIYNYRSTNIGYAATAGVLLMLLLAVLSLIYFRLIAKKVHYN